MEYEEHEKRAWCVDFSPAEPSMLVSGSDDCKVKKETFLIRMNVMNRLRNIYGLRFLYIVFSYTLLDGKFWKFQVKIWCTKQEGSVFNIDMKANICCVKYNPESSNFIAVILFLH